MQECIGDRMQVLCDEMRCPGDRDCFKEKREDRASSSRNSQLEIGEGKVSVSWMEREQEREYWQQRKA